jgi:hypothetical protein
MAKRMRNHSVAGLIGSRHLDDARRCEFGVEALCELAGDAARVLENGGDEVTAHFVERFSGISMAAAGVAVPADLRERTHSMRVSRILRICLSRVLQLTQHLTQSHSRTQWQSVHEMIDAWINSWGNDDRARHAQARFSTLTGLVQGREPRADFLYAALIEALSVIQA